MVILLNSRSKFNQHNQLCSSSVMLNQTTKNYQHGHEINCESDNLDDHFCENCESNQCQQNRFLAYTMSRSTSTLSLPFPSKSSRNTSNESYRLIQTQEKNCDEQTTIGTPSTVIQFSILVSKKAGHGEQDETTSNQINTMKDDNNNIIVTTDKPIRSTWGLPLLAEKLSTKTHGDVSNFKENPADVFDRPEANNLDTVNRMQQVLSSISFNSKDSLSLSSRAQERQKVANNLTKSDIDRPFSGNKSSKELNSKTKSRTNNFSFNSTFFQPVFSILFTFSYLYLLSNLTLTPSYALRAPFRSRSAFGFNQPAGPQPNEVRFVDLLARQNAKQHATIKYELLDSNFPPLVVRRGATFKMTIGLVKSYKPQLDKIRMEFMYGARPQLGKGTLIYLPITLNIPDNKDPNKWKAKILSVNDNQLLIEVYIPPTAAVSAWRLRISTKQNGSRNIKSFDVAEAIYILFNPWSKLDTVYLEREDLKQEFVLMDIGKIYIGSYNQPKGRQWIYGQFNRDVLPAIMYMMGKTRLDYAARANPIKVVRAIAQMVNSHDDNGLLVGNWSGDYKSGTPPWSWTGSAPILEQYYETNGEPVKFGQCWVFAGVTTTVCRALGIPARTVTNFVSAHDTDDSLTVDKFFDAKGQPITDVNADSIWNFHVWTDAWMTRPDLPAGYGGWQVIDATPQETSEGLYRTGPASVEAVRRGEIGLAYDAPFVFAEVNADLVHWKLDETSPLGWKKIMTNKHHVGRKIITKKVGYISEAPDTRDAEDITDRYKNKEGSAEERMSVLNAARAGGLAYLFEIPEPGREDIRFELVKIERVPIGQPFHIIVRMYNKSPIKRTITLSVNVNTVYYTGILAHKVKTEGREIDLAPNKVVEHRVNINVADYLPYLVDYSMLKIYAVASVKETSQTWSEEDDFAVEKPPLALTVVSSGHGLTVGVPFNLAIEIANPLDIVLTGCKLTVEGTSLVNRVQTVGISDINRKTKISHVVQLTPRRPGESNIVVTFQSRQLGDVYGSKTILIN